MSRNLVRTSVLIVLTALLVAGGMSGSVVATEHDQDETEDGPQLDPGYDKTPTFGEIVKEEYAGSSAAAATRDRKAFLKAKKAFHEARLDIQAIKKGDESPRQDVPTFFDDEDDGDD